MFLPVINKVPFRKKYVQKKIDETFNNKNDYTSSQPELASPSSPLVSSLLVLCILSNVAQNKMK